MSGTSWTARRRCTCWQRRYLLQTRAAVRQRACDGARAEQSRLRGRAGPTFCCRRHRRTRQRSWGARERVCSWWDRLRKSGVGRRSRVRRRVELQGYRSCAVKNHAFTQCALSQPRVKGSVWASAELRPGPDATLSTTPTTLITALFAGATLSTLQLRYVISSAY